MFIMICTKPSCRLPELNITKCNGFGEAAQVTCGLCDASKPKEHTGLAQASVRVPQNFMHARARSCVCLCTQGGAQPCAYGHTGRCGSYGFACACMHTQGAQGAGKGGFLYVRIPAHTRPCAWAWGRLVS